MNISYNRRTPETEPDTMTIAISFWKLIFYLWLTFIQVAFHLPPEVQHDNSEVRYTDLIISYRILTEFRHG